MFRFLRIAFPSFVVGVAVGAVGWYLTGPLFFDTVVSEELAQAEVSATGTFVDADSAHRGSGTVSVVTRADGITELQFTDFEVTNGPDLEVWLTAHPDPRSSADVKGADWLSLGQLKGNVGNQAYTVPAGTDLSAYPAVVIWCEQFGVLFSPAVLRGS
ncbi:DM13 domain-containing protein [Yoonia sp. R2331]|uniref:DM13 domain-containing protein n=1 Tax=Yoonia sp. R2331 TaxID=3237238 RepID=UPI0034E5A6B3